MKLGTARVLAADQLLHRRHQAGSLTGNPDEQFAGQQGLGNRLPSIVTAFALALLTDRVLFVDDPWGRYFGMFLPTFDCSYTQSRRGVHQTQWPRAGTRALHWSPRPAPRAAGSIKRLLSYAM